MVHYWIFPNSDDLQYVYSSHCATIMLCTLVTIDRAYSHSDMQQYENACNSPFCLESAHVLRITTSSPVVCERLVKYFWNVRGIMTAAASIFKAVCSHYHDWSTLFENSRTFFRYLGFFSAPQSYLHFTAFSTQTTNSLQRSRERILCRFSVSEFGWEILFVKLGTSSSVHTKVIYSCWCHSKIE